MDSTTSTDRITAWLKQQVDPAFEPLLQKIGRSGTTVRWEEEDFARTMYLEVGAREITYTIRVDPDSDPIAGQLLFKTPETESRRPFWPALDGCPKSPGEMTGPDIVNDLIDQYGRRLRCVPDRAGTPDG